MLATIIARAAQLAESHAMPSVFAMAVAKREAELDTPACAFCGQPGAMDVYREDGYPDAPCCADEDACHARVLAS